MKKKHFFAADVIIMIVSAFLLTGCMIGDDEKKPEIVEDPLATTEEYYISGKIQGSNESALEGVTVKTDNDVSVVTDGMGLYTLKLTTKGAYALTFEKEGYLTINTKATFAANAANRSALNFSLVMSKKSSPVTVESTEEETVVIPDENKETTYVEIPPKAVTEKTNISITSYLEPIVVETVVPGSNKQVSPALETAYFEPTGTQFTQPVVFAVANKAEKDNYFEELSLYHKSSENSDWVLESSTPVVFNIDANRYETKLTHFSSYSIKIKSTKNTSNENATEINATIKKDNSGNISAIRDFKIEFNEKAGWAFTEEPEVSIKNSLNGISNNSAKGLAEMVRVCVSMLEGGYPGYYTIPHSLTTNISGNSILFYVNKAKYCDLQYTFKIKHKKESKTIKVKVKRYTGMKETYTNQSADQHSGGGGF